MNKTKVYPITGFFFKKKKKKITPLLKIKKKGNHEDFPVDEFDFFGNNTDYMF